MQKLFSLLITFMVVFASETRADTECKFSENNTKLVITGNGTFYD